MDNATTSQLTIADLPRGESAAPPLTTPHFPARFQAVLWRNWEIVPLERLARVLATDEETLRREAAALGLRAAPQISADWQTRGYLTILRRNWHLLPYEQLLTLVDWTPQQMLQVLYEEDFLWIKFGNFKPECEPYEYAPLTPSQAVATAALRAQLHADFPDLDAPENEAPFAFVEMLKTPAPISARDAAPARDGEITLDESWTISYPRGSRVLAACAKRFRDAHAARWNIALNLREGDDGKTSEKVVLLRVAPDANQKPESHRIEVSPSRVLAEGVDENGVLRALQFLESSMKERGGPHLALGETQRATRFDLRIIHPYNAIYGDVLADENLDPLPDGLLSRLSERGVNGVWLQGLLYALYPWERAPELSAGYEKRLETLRHLCEKAGDYGIGVFLYFNEPRSLPLEYFERAPALQEVRGVSDKTLGVAGFCTSLPAVRDYLREGTAFLFRQVPQLAGLFTITRSENLTSCCSHPSLTQQCPRCRERPIADVIAETNAAIAEGAASAKPDARVLAWTWSWSHADDGSLSADGWVTDAIAQLPKNISVMSTSEEALPIEVAGVESTVLDYTMSNIGPGPHARAQWQIARDNGLQTVAKVQFNNTWENSAVPYIPVPDLVNEHLNNLEAQGVSGLLLSWSLGGFPSPNLELAAQRFWKETHGGAPASTRATQSQTHAPTQWDERVFGAASPQVRRAHEKFAAAFSEYPFHIGVVYGAPQNYGPSNLLHAAPTGHIATMIGFPYDDLQGWRSVYPVDIFESQWKIVSETWREGLRELDAAQQEMESNAREYSQDARDTLRDLQTVATAAYLHFRSVYLQVAFVIARDALSENTGTETAQFSQRVQEILREEIEIAQQLESLMTRDARIGFEASNHYYYVRQDLREKAMSCRQLQAHFATAV